MAERKLVALTFDDGPTLGITDKVLDVLEENNVVASFFLIGQNITEQTMDIYADATEDKKKEVMTNLEGKIVL